MGARVSDRSFSKRGIASQPSVRSALAANLDRVSETVDSSELGVARRELQSAMSGRRQRSYAGGATKSPRKRASATAKSKRRHARKHEQLSMLVKDGSRLRVDGRGGRRKNAGRKPKGRRAGSPHKTRAVFSPRSPLHVVLRADKEIGNLRNEAVYEAVRVATNVVGRWASNVRIVHMSIQGSHLHLLVEATHRYALSTGMQAFQISAAKRINRAVSGSGPRRKGRVFSDRYHVEVLVTPTQVHHAMNYILNNWRHHGEHTQLDSNTWTLDRFSSAILFRGWREGSWRIPADYKPLAMQPAQTWLASVGWRRGGTPISCYSVPGDRRAGEPRIIEVDLFE